MDWSKPTRSLDGLIPSVKEKVEQVLEQTLSHGMDVLGLDTYRDPWTQARLYRQSRVRQDIENKVERLSYAGFTNLSKIIWKVGPQSGVIGRHVTNAGPGESWHQFGEAWDACPMFDSKRLLWDITEPPDDTRAKVMWQTYGECIRRVGLEWAGDWTTFREYPHSQLRSVANPLHVLNPDEVDRWAKEHGWW